MRRNKNKERGKIKRNTDHCHTHTTTTVFDLYFVGKFRHTLRDVNDNAGISCVSDECFDFTVELTPFAKVTGCIKFSLKIHKQIGLQILKVILNALSTPFFLFIYLTDDVILALASNTKQMSAAPLKANHTGSRRPTQMLVLQALEHTKCQC